MVDKISKYIKEAIDIILTLWYFIAGIVSFCEFFGWGSEVGQWVGYAMLWGYTIFLAILYLIGYVTDNMINKRKRSEVMNRIRNM